jgi:hypothetical protein
MKGLGIGQQLGWLTGHINALEPSDGIGSVRKAALRPGLGELNQ